jgi:hypothetical protein
MLVLSVPVGAAATPGALSAGPSGLLGRIDDRDDEGGLRGGGFRTAARW